MKSTEQIKQPKEAIGEPCNCGKARCTAIAFGLDIINWILDEPSAIQEALDDYLKDQEKTVTE